MNLCMLIAKDICKILNLYYISFFLIYSCWLSYDNGAIWAFAAPVAGIILVVYSSLLVAYSVSNIRLISALLTILGKPRFLMCSPFGCSEIEE